jgi:hypothetical protein
MTLITMAKRSDQVPIKIAQGVLHGLEPPCDLLFVGRLRQGAMIAVEEEQRLDIAKMLVAIKMVGRVRLGPA